MGGRGESEGRAGACLAAKGTDLGPASFGGHPCACCLGKAGQAWGPGGRQSSLTAPSPREVLGDVCPQAVGLLCFRQQRNTEEKIAIYPPATAQNEQPY